MKAISRVSHLIRAPACARLGKYRFDLKPPCLCFKVLLNFWNVHHDEGVWTDPWSFRIERFVEEEQEEETVDTATRLISSDSVLRKK